LPTAYPVAVTLLFLTVAAVSARSAYNESQFDVEVYQALESDILRLTNEQTVVVMADTNRGAWWRIKRPVVDDSRLSRVVGRDHVLVVPTDVTGWEERYTALHSRHPIGGQGGGYHILRPRPFGCPGAHKGGGVNLSYAPGSPRAHSPRFEPFYLDGPQNVPETPRHAGG
jgi:hypothetical protein